MVQVWNGRVGMSMEGQCLLVSLQKGLVSHGWIQVDEISKENMVGFWEDWHVNMCVDVFIDFHVCYGVFVCACASVSVCVWACKRTMCACMCVPS